MQLWGRVVKWVFFLFAAGFVVAAIFGTEGRLGLLVNAAVCAAIGYGAPRLARLFEKFTGDETLLEQGVSARATVTAVRPTAWRFGRYGGLPIVRFSLSVEAAGAGPKTVFQVVPREILPSLAPGCIVGVRLDPTDHDRLVIDWRVPVREADGRAPSATPSTTAQPGAKSSQYTFFAVGALLFGLVFLGLSFQQRTFESRGVSVSGVVLDKTYVRGSPHTGASTGTGFSTSSKHYISYRFTTQDGRTLEGKTDVLPGTWDGLTVGGPVTVQYLPDAPDDNRVAGQLASSWTFRIMAIVLLAVSGWLFMKKRKAAPAHV